jgi:S1-C subfamily serine protease
MRQLVFLGMFSLFLGPPLPLDAQQPVAPSQDEVEQAKSKLDADAAAVVAARALTAAKEKAVADSISAIKAAIDRKYAQFTTPGNAVPPPPPVKPSKLEPPDDQHVSATIESARLSVAAVLGADGKAIGAATLVAKDRLLTARHVVGNAKTLKVRFPVSSELEATVLAMDEATDLALLKVASGVRRPIAAASTVPPAGERIFLIGSPFGFADSLTAGILSNPSRDVSLSPTGPVLRGCYQTDASVSPGSSGGALLNKNGELLGIVNSLKNAGLGFVVPIGHAQALLKGQASSRAMVPFDGVIQVVAAVLPEEKVQPVPAPQETILPPLPAGMLHTGAALLTQRITTLMPGKVLIVPPDVAQVRLLVPEGANVQLVTGMVRQDLGTGSGERILAFPAARLGWRTFVVSVNGRLHTVGSVTLLAGQRVTVDLRQGPVYAAR